MPYALCDDTSHIKLYRETLTIGAWDDRVRGELIRGRHRNCVHGAPRQSIERRLGTQDVPQEESLLPESFWKKSDPGTLRDPALLGVRIVAG
jgi:hypothetical protein